MSKLASTWQVSHGANSSCHWVFDCISLCISVLYIWMQMIYISLVTVTWHICTEPNYVFSRKLPLCILNTTYLFSCDNLFWFCLFLFSSPLSKIGNILSLYFYKFTSSQFDKEKETDRNGNTQCCTVELPIPAVCLHCPNFSYFPQLFGEVGECFHLYYSSIFWAN